MAQLTQVNRRDFFKKTGFAATGLALQAALVPGLSRTVAAASGQTGAVAASFNIFVHIAENDRVTIIAHRSEMGQGIRTGLPQIVADELEADWDKVDVLQAQGDAKYGNQNTDGSRSVRDFYQPMRELGASARLMLRQAAAARWQVPLASCVAKDHRVTHTPTGRTLRYGELAMAAAKLPVPEVKTLVLKTPAEFKYIGKPMTAVDFVDIVRGTTQFGIDTQVPDMLYASIERCPVLGGKVKSYDASKALRIPGVVQAIPIEGGIEPAGFNPLAGIAVIATNTWAAMEGRKALTIVWDNKKVHAHYDTKATLDQHATAPAADAKVVFNSGNVEQALAEAAHTYAAVYRLPHLEHATMEPPAATASVTGDACEIWACVQDPQGAKKTVAELLGFKEEQVTINVTLLGGGFGRKSKPDFVVEAVMLAQKVGKPVKVTWTREDVTRHGYYHAYSVQHYRAALNAQHQITGLNATVASPTILSLFQAGAQQMQDWELGQGFTTVLYNIPNLRARNEATPAHTRIGWMRSVYHANHAFGLNSFMDELARLHKIDPLQYHLDALNADLAPLSPTATAEQNEQIARVTRLKNTLRAVQKSSAWPAAVAAAEGWGIAAHRSFDSYVAVATKVSVINKQLRILEVHLAVDCGQVVNPDRVQAQMEGAVVFALSSALLGEITFEQGAVKQSSFDDYPLLRITHSPKIVVTLIDSTDKHGGVGEPGVPPVAASVTNAIVAAGGPRIRDLPIKHHLQLV